MNTLHKEMTMTPTAKAVLDATTTALSKTRAENAALKRENERLQRALDTFPGSPSKAARSRAQKATRYHTPPVVTPVLNPDRTVDKIATAIKAARMSPRR